MRGHHPDITTFRDKVLLLPCLGLTLSQTFVAALAGPFRGPNTASSYKEHVFCYLIRSLLSNFSAGQMQLLLPSSISAYETWASKHKIESRAVKIPNTSVYGFWLGADVESAKYHMIFFHGGGFALPATDQHIDLMLRFIKWAKVPVAVFAVCYTLSPGAVYPQALSECVEGLRYMLAQPGVKPETSLIGGDSAGGNLTLAVLSHIAHPHPNPALVVPLKLGEGEKLLGALLITPWVSIDEKKYPSMTKWGGRDIINHGHGVYWMDCYKSGLGRMPMQKDDEYITAVLAPVKWWEEIPVKKALVTAGGEEGLVDAISAFVETFKQGFPGECKYVIGKGEYHDRMLDGQKESVLDAEGDANTEAAVRNWIRENLV